MPFLATLAPIISGVATTAIAGKALFGGGGSAPTLTRPGSTSPLQPPTNISTPSLGFNRGTLTRNTPAFIPGHHPQ